MKGDDYFDFNQYPDFMGLTAPFDEDPFEDEEELADEDNIVDRPFLPLRDVVLFPQMVMPLFVGRERSLAAIHAALQNGETLIVAAQADSEVFEPTEADIYRIGTETVIGRALRMPDTTTSVLAQGRRRVEILEFTQWEPYIRVRARVMPEPTEWQRTTEALMRAVLALFEKVVDLSRKLPDEAYTFAINIDEPGWLADFIASTMDTPLHVREDILETLDPTSRLQKVSIILAQELNVLEMEDQIHSQVQQEVDKMQREHFLREQMRVIQNELGETDVFTQELSELRVTIEEKALPEEARAKVDKEMARLNAMPPMAPEIGIIRTYLDWILELPWMEKSDDNLDVSHAAEVLDADHYALEKVKDRILEYIAVRKIAADNMRTPILCFVGPPGTGKTSLGQSIARALNREFLRISLGGVRDEAEIRGHRRTYIGALPGRVIQAMRRAGTINPLFMLDEVDKLGQDFRGDPAAALLEVLDPEQNKAFVDHYLDLDYDLSNVLFVTTANVLDTIPPALQDRMEVIEFPGYLEEEKLEIARHFLIPRQTGQHGLAEAGLHFDDNALKMMIRQYTYEAGVRNLEREIANVCRKVARRVAEKRRYPRRITGKQVVDLLGPPRMTQEFLREEDEVGVATGVAWTAAGGDILFIEVTLMPGKGTLTLTGQLGEVMQESAQAAMSYTRSQGLALGLKEEIFENTDVHIHIPEGAVPKDGPSAGVAMVTALVSAFTNRPVRRDVGLTGEITLRGRVLPVGGIREKALAARRAGITTFILPSRNENDLFNIPKKLRQDLKFVKVDRMNQVLEVALLQPLPIKVQPAKKRRKPATLPAPAAPPS
ncbi:MAG: endopeptidase La [Chloroflexi bacterium]|nr:endopeptidase La [Chloroflexota bacterium]MCI0578958.1 endopeptidase La [Chloroflexota bacterium]MCI0645104.1 endopeptidase La [Chloroflexota bacterium]MCI0731939.1 endopeptidase La [Chloroflexota bacterium]